jgi:hypothetical protein
MLLSPQLAADPVAHVSSSSAAAELPSVNVPMPAGLQPGDVVIAQFGFRGSPGRAYTAPAGWTEFAPRTHAGTATAGQNQAMFYRVVGSSEPASYTWSIQAVDSDRTHLAVTKTAYRNVNAGDPIYTWAANGGTVVNPVAPSITVDGTPTGTRTASSGGGSRHFVAHSVALKGAASSQSRLLAAWSRAHQQDVIPPAGMTQRATNSDGSGANGIRVTIADENLVVPIANSISGTILEDDGTPVPNVEVVATGGHDETVFTNASGEYQFANVAEGAENITITPALEGFVFDPEFRFIAGPVTDDVSGQDFVATAAQFRISGTILDGDGLPIEDVLVEATGGHEDATFTDASGFYQFLGIEHGTENIEIVPSLAGYSFDPASRFVPGPVEGHVDGQDFLGIAADPGSFNAFDIDTPGGSTIGAIRTKIAAQAFDIDVVAIGNDGNVDAGYNRAVEISLLDASDNSGAMDGNGCRASWQPIHQLPGTFNAWINGRQTISGITEPSGESWPEVRILIHMPHPPGQQATACSTDAFAIRPAAFTDVRIRDADWETAGNSRDLDNTGANGGVVHKAGRPFRIDATAVNAVGAPTLNYSGSPRVTVECMLPAGNCVDGNLNPGAWNVSGGELSTTEATYSESGTLRIVIEDRQFASIDAGDGSTSAERYIRSDEVEIGRFVPDRFELEIDTEPEFLTFNDGTCPARQFTYIGAPFSYATRPVATVRALNAQGNVTRNYSHELWKLDAAGIDQTYGADTDPSPVPAHALDVGMINAAIVESDDDGTGTVTSHANDELSFIREAVAPGADPPEPYTADITLSVDVEDASENGLPGNGIIRASAPFVFDGNGAGGIAFDAGNEFRYGRLRLTNVIGPETRDLLMPVHAETWREVNPGSGVFGWMTEGGDSCTALTQGDFSLEDNLVGTGISNFSAIDGGEGTVTLSAPGTGNVGTENIVGELLDEFPWLRFDWQGNGEANPRGRAAFGLFDSNPRRLYQLERF